MRKVTLAILIVLCANVKAQKRQGWQFAIEQQISINADNPTYNDTGNVVDISFVSKEGSSVKMWYRLYDSTSGKNYTEPKNETFPIQAFSWLVLTDIDATYMDTLNKYVFSKYGIKAIRKF